MSAKLTQDDASPLSQPDLLYNSSGQTELKNVASQDFFTNDDMKHRILNIYAKFVSDVEPDPLCDWLVQEGVISLEQSMVIRCENCTQQKRCRALLDFLFSTQHPRAFLVVRQALSDQSHYLLEFINNQESRCGNHGLANSQKVSLAVCIARCILRFPGLNLVLHEQTFSTLDRGIQVYTDRSEKLFFIEQRHEQERKAWNEEKEQLVNEMKEHQRLVTDSREKSLAVEQNYEQEKKAWSEEKEGLMKKIQDLQRLILRDELRHKSDPLLVKTISTKAAEMEKQAIRGMTILGKEMFVVNWESSIVEVYDSMTFNLSRQWNLKELINPVDIVSCSRNKCLYIFDHKGRDQSKEILRVDPNGNLIKHWSTGNDYGHGLSVTDEANVLLPVFNKNKLSEYSPNGNLIREINLSSDTSICHPRHTIRLNNGHYLVSHGIDNELHRVCIVDAEGKLKKSFGGKPGSTIGQMSYPIYLAVDENGFVMVADRGNQRVLLLDSDLEFVKEILSGERYGLRRVWSILLEKSNGRLYVTDNEFDSKTKIFRDGRIFIFNLK